MIFDRNENNEVVVLLGAGSMGTAIAKRIATGRKVLLGDISEKISRTFLSCFNMADTMWIHVLSMRLTRRRLRRLHNVRHR